MIALAPFGYLFAIFLLPQVDAHTRAGFSINRRDAVDQTLRLAAEKGAPAGQVWDDFVTAVPYEEDSRNPRSPAGWPAEGADAPVPRIGARVLLLSPDWLRSFEAMWDVASGELLGFRVEGRDLAAGEGEETSRLPDSASMSVPLVGDVSVILLRAALIAFLLITLLLLDTRYFKKLRDQEAAIGRVVTLSLFLAGLFIIVGQVFSDRWRFELAELLPAIGEAVFPAYSRYLGYGLAVGFAVMIALAWCRCESDVREAFASKLIPLDAIFSGRIFNHNVARSFLFGAGLAGWAVTFKSLVCYTWRDPSGIGLGLSQLDVFVARNPGVSALVLPLTLAVTHTLLGLLVPLPLLHRKIAPRYGENRVFWALGLILVAYFTLDGWISTGAGAPLIALLLSASVSTATLILPFRWFDVMTAFFTVLVSRVTILITYLRFQPHTQLQEAGDLAIGIAVLTVSVAVMTAVFAEKLVEEEVLPIYAKNIHERLKIEARIRAAQEAQHSMLPAQEPEINGGSIKWAHRTSYKKGGDYHDYFTLPDGRTGIFLAEFKGHPLQVAVAIPLIKGFLVSYTQQETEPAQVLRQLERQLGSSIPEIRSLVYMNVDFREQIVEHAKLGNEELPMMVRRESVRDIVRLRSPDARSPEASREYLGNGDTLMLCTLRAVSGFDEKAWEGDLRFGLRIAVNSSPSRKAKQVLRRLRALVVPVGTVMVICLDRRREPVE